MKTPMEGETGTQISANDAKMSLLLVFLCLLLSLEVWNVNGMHVLVMGDSIDRHSILAWCRSFAFKDAVPWTNNYLSFFGKTVIGGFHCDAPALKTTMSTLQMFGTNSTGPYYHEGQIREDGNIADTSARIKYAIELYCSKFSLPDLVLFHTSMWDFQWFWGVKDVWYQIDKPGSQYRLDLLKRLYHTLNDRLDEIIVAANHSCGHNNNISKLKLALRSDLYWPFGFKDVNGCSPNVGQSHMHDMKEMQRQLAYDRNISYFDLDYDIWSKFDYNYSECNVIFADGLHPKPIFAAEYFHKLAGLRYTAAYRHPHHNHDNHSHDHINGFPPLFATNQLQLELDNDDNSNSSSSNSSSSNSSGSMATIVTQRVLLVRPPAIANGNDSSHTVYFLTYHKQHKGKLLMFRHAIGNVTVTEDLLSFYHLGEADIFNVTSLHVWKQMTDSPDKLPSEIITNIKQPKNQSLIVYDNQTSEYWLLQGNGRRMMACQNQQQIVQTMAYFNSSSTLIFTATAADSRDGSNRREEGPPLFYADYLELFYNNDILPNIFYDQALYRLSSDRSVYVTLNKTKRRVDSAEVMRKHGWSFDQVLVLDEKIYREDVNLLLPIGPDLID